VRTECVREVRTEIGYTDLLTDPGMPDPRQVRSMFASIAPRYDLLNRLLSLGIDRRWRRALLLTAGDVRGKRVIDLCCGTGDVAFLLARHGARVLGLDFTAEMLRVATARRTKADTAAERGVLLALGDACALPVPSASAEVVTIAFGIRNVADRAAGLRDVARVLRPGGRLAILEFGHPRNRLLAGIYRFYFHRVLPRVGALLSGDRHAYSYLPESVAAWPSAEAFGREIEAAGFRDCAHRPLLGGVAFVHWATVVERRG
jgi:demethylmenaquinone methyltransferase/2-methoxy-6-polyprenyl-1,4-benzoquinol methylase